MITLVKKVSAAGCRKCAAVDKQLRRDGLWHRIDEVLYTGRGGQGDALARRHGVRVAPFFVVRQEGGDKVYTSYLRMRRDLVGRVHAQDAAEELARDIV